MGQGLRAPVFQELERRDVSGRVAGAKPSRKGRRAPVEAGPRSRGLGHSSPRCPGHPRGGPGQGLGGDLYIEVGAIVTATNTTIKKNASTTGNDVYGTPG
jgi:hypothetical protein